MAADKPKPLGIEFQITLWFAVFVIWFIVLFIWENFRLLSDWLWH